LNWDWKFSWSWVFSAPDASRDKCLHPLCGVERRFHTDMPHIFKEN